MALDTEEARRALYREIVQSLTLMDDIFMTRGVSEQSPLCRSGLADYLGEAESSHDECRYAGHTQKSSRS